MSVTIQLINLAFERRPIPDNTAQEVAATFEIVSSATATRDAFTVRYRVPHDGGQLVNRAHREFRATIEAIHQQTSKWVLAESEAPSVRST